MPFDRQTHRKTGALPGDIRSFGDFARAVPIAGQADYRDVFKEVDSDMDKSFEILFGEARLRDLHLLTTTSGTTGTPTPYPVFHKSTEAMGELFGRIGWRMNIRPGDKLAICFGLSMHAPAFLTCTGSRTAGPEPVPDWRRGRHRAHIEPHETLQSQYLQRHTLPGSTPYRTGSSSSDDSVKSLGLKILVCGAEPGAGIPEVRRRLESEYGAKVFDIGAGYGVSCDHPDYQGMHWIADDYCYYELVNPETLEPVPMVHGATGLAVLTPLEPDSTIFFHNLRFTLNDIHQIYTDPCPCGFSGFRYKIVGRSTTCSKSRVFPCIRQPFKG